MSEGAGTLPLQQIAGALSSRGIAATVVDDAVVALLPRRYPTADGGQQVTFLHCRIHSLAELGALLGDDGSEAFWKEALAEMEAATTAAERIAVDRIAADRVAAGSSMHFYVDRLLPQFGMRSVICGMVAFLLSTAAWQDLTSMAPRAPLGTISVALFFLRQAYRSPVAVTPETTLATGPARLYSLGAAAVFLVMLMLLGHSGDGFLFGGAQRPVNTMAVFMICVVMLVFMRGGEQREGPASVPPGRGFFGMPLQSAEAALAVGGLVWLLVLSLMPPHRPVFEHGFVSQPALEAGAAAQGHGP